ncbi:MAG: S9 family peptidase [Alphaproteobacteria bacterium]|nr:MAG: S9 family peptidase [Alphaproteobacteria bacterium]
MADKRTGSFGSWSSPITAETVAAAAVPLSEPRVDGDDIYWIEGRPLERGRGVIMLRRADSTPTCVTKDPFDARTQVHSYGGGAYAVENGIIYFVNYSDGQIYRQTGAGAAPAQITSSPAAFFADLCVDRWRNRLIAVKEERPNGDVVKAINKLVAADIASGVEMVLDDAYDFYSSPNLSTDGCKLAWLSWRHPYMPWMCTHLHVADVDAHGLVNKRRIGSGTNESIFQPQWSPDGRLYFISDRTGFWNIYRSDGPGVQEMLRRDAEFGVPQWIFGLSTYAFVSAETLIYCFTKQGSWYLGRLDTRTLAASDFIPEFASLSGLRATKKSAVVLCSTATAPPAIATVAVDSGTVSPFAYSIGRKRLEALEPYFTGPQAIQFPTADGDRAHGFYYPPGNPDWQAQAGDKPPLIVRSHGGPTSAATCGLSLSVQYWTSRGFAVLDVNYRGSTGYGRKYRDKLYGQWGVIDVEDCIAGATYLADRGEVDGRKLLIAGGSSGGYTTLCALTFHDVFAAGASYYGIGDVAALATDTHKFELHYMDWLVEPYRPGSALYHDRSPMNFVDRLAAPVIFLHGEDDPVVPLSQAQTMFSALQTRDIPSCLIVFQGEKHGFKQAAHIRQALEAELMFYAINVLRSPLYS